MKCGTRYTTSSPILLISQENVLKEKIYTANRVLFQEINGAFTKNFID